MRHWNEACQVKDRLLKFNFKTADMVSSRKGEKNIAIPGGNFWNMLMLLVHWAGERTSLVAQKVKHLPTMRETWVWSLGQEDPLEKKMATHSSTLAWKIPWIEEPGRLQSIGPQRVGHDWATSLLPVPNPTHGLRVCSFEKLGRTFGLWGRDNTKSQKVLTCHWRWGPRGHSPSHPLQQQCSGPRF